MFYTAEEQSQVAEVQQVIRGFVEGRWSLANAKAWFERHCSEEPEEDEPPAVTLSRKALEAIKAGYGGAPREWIEEKLAELAA